MASEAGRRRGLPWALTALLAVACSPSAPPAERTVPAAGRVDPPAVAGSMAPHLAAAGDDVLLSWLEPAALAAGQGHRLRFARYRDGAWGEALTITAGTDLFANWADCPHLVAAGEAGLLAAWLARTGAGKYDYGVELARSSDQGRTWRTQGRLHGDAGAGEHGFVSLLPSPDGGWAFWLDGRDAVQPDGAMALRARRLGEPAGPEEVLDARVCDCCPTAATMTARGPVVVYRDRSDEEVRDLYLIGRGPDGWSAPRRVAADGWQIAGCPVNGPAVVAAGDALAVAWFTGADERPRVEIAFSADGGESFGAPLEVDAHAPVGRVALAALAPGEVALAWLAGGGGEERAELRLARISAATGVSATITVAHTGPGRGSGYPRLLHRDGRLLLAWVETAGAGPGTLRFADLSLAALAPR